MDFGLVKKWHAQEVESTQDWGTEISSPPFPAMFLTRLTVRVPGTRPGKYIEKHATFQTVNHEDEESGVLDDLFSNVHGTSAVVCERKAGGQGAKPGQAS